MSGSGGPQDSRQPGWTFVLGAVAVVVAAAIGVVPELVNWVQKEDLEFSCGAGGHNGLSKIRPISVAASSELPATADELPDEQPPQVTYGADQAFDGSDETGWAEGATGDGIGEWVRVRLPPKSRVSLVCVVNGYTRNHDDYLRNQRVHVLRVCGERCQDVTLEDMDPEDSQNRQGTAVDVGAGDEVTLTISSVYHGSGSKATAISEIELWGPS